MLRLYIQIHTLIQQRRFLDCRDAKFCVSIKDFGRMALVAFYCWIKPLTCASRLSISHTIGR
jgi:hypothetical protein